MENGAKKKQRNPSVKRAFVPYFFLCMLVALYGSYLIGIGNNALQEWYDEKHSGVRFGENRVIEWSDEDEEYAKIVPDERPAADQRTLMMYAVISNLQFVLIPLWVYVCVMTAGMIFYSRNLKRPITLLQGASEKIAANELDFKLEYGRKDEMGQLCDSFDKMRAALNENNRSMWRMIEERKRLNAAFSHDLRTPLTVLRGYDEFLERYVPEGQVSPEKLMEVLGMMRGQIERLENYTVKMSAVQKLEDIAPDFSKVKAETLGADLKESGRVLCRDKSFHFLWQAKEGQTLQTDVDLVREVYENLVANAARYAQNNIDVTVIFEEQKLTITVDDDGRGFGEKALRLAAEPFFRGEEAASGGHFGLGLYICRVICEKLGGSLRLLDTGTGARAVAEFFSKS